MAKIVRFKTPQDSMIEALEGLVERAKHGEFNAFVLSAQCTDGTIATAWSNADVGKRNELTSHLQVDVMYSVIEANMDRLVEYV